MKLSKLISTLLEVRQTALTDNTADPDVLLTGLYGASTDLEEMTLELKEEEQTCSLGHTHKVCVLIIKTSLCTG